jgi:hypothetical protein
MSVLRSLENKIADLVEGAFGRAFRSEITPVELARRLVREMDRERRGSLSGSVPNEFVVALSPGDRRHFAAVEGTLIDELAAHLLEHARAERLALPSRPQIEFRTDPRLSLGVCTITASVNNSPPPAVARRHGVPPPAPATGTIAPAAPPPAPPAGPPALAGELLPRAWLEAEGQRIPLGASGVVIGRSADVDVVIPAQEVSRRHAQILPDAGGWTLHDLGSTNGVRVNGRNVGVPTQLTDGDVIGIGPVELVFEAG